MTLSTVSIARPQETGTPEKPGLLSRLLSELRMLAICSAGGAVLGLSAPGFDQWYLAWLMLVPLLLMIFSSRSVLQATLRGLVFGFAYHVVYMNWYSSLYPLSWLGLSPSLSLVAAVVCFLFENLHQAVLIAMFAGIARALPLRGGLLPSADQPLWKLPSLLVLPLLWVLCTNKIGNASDLCGVPWAMLEYTQYRQLPFLQAASIIGGVGVEFLMVAVNVALATVVATRFQSLRVEPLLAPSGRAAKAQLAGSLSLVLAFCLWGVVHLSTWKPDADIRVSCLQTNAAKDDPDPKAETGGFKEAAALSNSCKPGLCLWPAVDFPLQKSQRVMSMFAQMAKSKQLDIIIGALHISPAGRYSHALYTFDSQGNIGRDFYQKRLLVPVSEYKPEFYHLAPSGLTELISHLRFEGESFEAGVKPTVFTFKAGKIAPLICFEVISPDAASASVRNGGQLLVDIADRSWFHDPNGWMMGRQQLSMAVMRAVENRRYFVYTANTGPSAIIEPTGRVASQAPIKKSMVLEGKVQMLSRPSVFNQICDGLDALLKRK